MSLIKKTLFKSLIFGIACSFALFDSLHADSMSKQGAQAVALAAENKATNQNQEQFASLLHESGLRFTMPAGFHEIAVENDYVLPYEKRLRTDDKGLEIRYAIRPLKRIEIAYDDPHNAAPHPNDLFEMLFRTISETLAGQTYVRSHIYNTDQARKKYNAGWAAAAVFDVSSDVSKKYKQGLLLAIHHNDKADAYLLFLTNDLEKQKAAIKKAQTSLTFSHFDKGINQPTL